MKYLQLTKIKLRIGKTIIHPLEIIKFHAENGRTFVKYRDAVDDLANAYKIVEVELDTCDIEILME